MNGRWRRTVPGVVALLALLSGPVAGEAKPGKLEVDTALHSAAGEGTLHGLLRAGTPVTHLETDGDWVKVRIEGWVQASAVEGLVPASSRAAETPPPLPPTMLTAAPPPATRAASSVPPAAASATYPIEGMIRVKLGRMKKKTGVGAQVWLLPASFQPGDVGSPSAEADAARLETLDAEAALLKKEADRALQQITNFTEATETRDELMAQRAKVLSEREDILAVQHGRHEAAAREAALDSAVADSRGWFNFPSVVQGEYTIYARMIEKNLDLQWVEAVNVGSGSVKLDLDESNAQGLAP